MGKGLMCSVGINDANYAVYHTENIDGKIKIVWRCPFYSRWANMLQRSYSKKLKSKHPSYKKCTVCDEWLTFSNFKKWMENQNWEGKDLDKDLLVENSKIYSPETCVFVSNEVNKFLTTRSLDRGLYPIGVYFHKPSMKYISQIKINGNNHSLGVFKYKHDAHIAWQNKKLQIALDIKNGESDEKVIFGLQRIIDKLRFDINNKIETASL